MKTNHFFYLLLLVLAYSCSPAGGNKTGHEYMPDMAHAVSYEANVQQYYSLHHWGGIEDYQKYAIPRNQVKGTIARGSSGYNPLDSSSTSEYHNMMDGSMNNRASNVTANGHKNYYYKDNEDERLKAIREITSNAIPLTKTALENGKSNYNIYCGICHGEKGDGAGYLVRDDGGKYPAQPANFLKDEFIAASEGRYYHAIMYGRNMMNGYSNKLSYPERWEVIHYIRSLQASSKNLKYSPEENTFSNSQAVQDARKVIVTSAPVATTVKK